ncbi:proteophosphoglycan ppg4 [Colletotrichum truncatum]|uniref:Proteophosphoglycan ppg4 n=1 Tax=Colletotrichum truncatum TaxID=5467 RepID=A0ACC3Z0V8_COLTU|nr:proteophosphoglycan ppg4 [Colletotrichum truncatum]KAF6800508.1 proteophosphoglycan ppg4 [Colletotrichum truncatum]
MGNTHSVESTHHSSTYGNSSKRSPQKLSKPRVGNHVSTPPSQAAGLLGSHDRTASFSLPPSRSNSRLVSQTHLPRPSTSNGVQTNTTPPTQTIPPVPPVPEDSPEPSTRDWKRRASLFRSKSSQDSRRKDKRRQTIMVNPEISDRMSRANSMTWESQKDMDQARQLQVDSWLVPGNRQSINYNLMSYESRRLLNLNEELTACEESSIMSESHFEVSRFQISPSTWKSSHPLHPQPASAQITRANSDVSLYAPVRRRSMVLTPGLATRIPSAADYSSSRRSSFRRSMPATPAFGQSRLNSIESSLNPPALFDEFVAEQDLPELLHPPVKEPIERALTPSDMDYRPLGAMKFGSLRITNGAASPLPSPDLEPPAEQKTLAEQLTNPEYAVPEDSMDEDDRGRKDLEGTVLLVQSSAVLEVHSPRTTSLLGTEMARSGPNSPLSPVLKVASKHTAMEDELFEDDMQTEYSAEILSVRNDPNAKPSIEQLQADQSQRQSRGVARADSGVVTSPTSEYQPKPLSKADSGYSSNVSLRSFHAKKTALGKGKNANTALDESDDEKSDSSLSPIVALPATSHINIDDVAIAGAGSAPSTLPSQPAKSDQPSPNSTAMAVTSPRSFFNLSAANAFRRDRKTPVVLDGTKVPQNGPTSPESTPSSGAGSDKSNSVLAIGSGSQRASKFQRFLTGSGMRGPPAVHTTHPADDTIPTVPSTVKTKLEEHSGRFPTSTKRLTLRTQASKDTLKTIFSVGSTDATQMEDCRDSSPVAERTLITRKPVAQTAEEVDEPKTPRRRHFQSVPSSIAQAAASVMPRRSIHRKPVPSTNAEKDESVSESVGRSLLDQPITTMSHQDESHKPASRTFTMTAQMERNMGIHLQAQELMPMPGDGAFISSPHSQHFPELSSKKKTSPPVSLYTRSGKTFRKQAPVRPHSASSSEPQLRRQSLSRQSSRETIHSYPSASPLAVGNALAVPPIPPMSPRRYSMLDQQSTIQHRAPEERWRPISRPGFEPSQNVRPAIRSLPTASSTAQPTRQLRHRASYDGFSPQYRGPVAQGRPSVGQPVNQYGTYYQQLVRIEQQQREKEEREQHQREQQDYFSPDSIQPGLTRSRSRSRSVHAHGNPPYRVLHSYNSPAYRNVPIWG